MRSRHKPPTAGTRTLGPGRVFSLVAAALLAATAHAADTPPDRAGAAGPAPGRRRIRRGRDPRHDRGPESLRWQAASFVAPFEFAVKDVNAIQWPPPAGCPSPPATSASRWPPATSSSARCSALDDRKVEAGDPPPGQDPRAAVEPPPDLPLARRRRPDLPRAERPDRLARAGRARRTGARTRASRRPTRRAPRSAATSACPPRASIEFEISWKTKPDFVFALGVDDKDDTVKRAFRFEAWGGDLVVQRELEQEADLAVVQEVAAGPGRTHLQAYLDQKEGRILVFSPGGKQLADLKVAGNKPAALARASTWPTSAATSGWSGCGSADGTARSPARPAPTRPASTAPTARSSTDNLTGFEPDSKEFVLKTDSGESRIAEDKVSSVFLSPPSDEAPRMIRAVYQDGSRVSGDLDQVEGGHRGLKVPGLEESLQAADRRPALAGGRWATRRARSKAGEHAPARGRRHPPGRPPGGRPRGARRELPGLAPGRQHDGQPAQARRLGQDHLQGAARPAPARQAAATRSSQRHGRHGVPVRPGPGRDAVEPRAARARSGASLYLRSGDVIPSVITGIDENGVRFRSSMSNSTFVPHDKVKAVELAPEQPITVKLNKTKRERLLTLPRMQKASPPTHLIRSRNGDYLRGRVLDDGRQAGPGRDPARGEGPAARPDRADHLARIPRSSTRRRSPPTDGQATRVQAVRNDGIRVTFIPEQFAGDTLSGKSDVLGAARVRVGEIDQLLIGGGIEEAAAHLTYRAVEAPERPRADRAGQRQPRRQRRCRRRRDGNRVALGRQAGPRLRPRARGGQEVPPGRQQGEGRRARLLGHLVRPVHPGHAAGREGRRRVRREGRAARRRQPPGDAAADQGHAGAPHSSRSPASRWTRTARSPRSTRPTPSPRP